jgi:chemotaxis protein methyltransferase CheR
MTGPDFDHFCRLVRERSGLILGPEKAYLIRGRLDPVAQAEGLGDAAELLARLARDAPEALVLKSVTALATHESSFFRDVAPFEVLASQVLPDLIAARGARRTLRIWCAACSSGQEPYSVAVVLKEFGERLAGWRIEIVATDFSEPILAKAKAGLYSDFEVRRGLSPQRLERWFEPLDAEWRIRPELRSMVSFRHHNLLHGTAGLGVFDIILCRNVLIYFDQDRKRQVLEDVGRALAPDGAMFLGTAETILGVSCGLEPVPGGRGLCRKAAIPPIAQAS